MKGTAFDRAGNMGSAMVTNISIDKTPPVVTVTGVANNAVYIRGNVPVAGCTTTDALSGVLNQPTLGVTGGTVHAVGFYRASCTGASDKAGNSGSALAAYQVVYPITPFSPPVANPPSLNTRHAGSTVPIKFALGGKSTRRCSSSRSLTRATSLMDPRAAGPHERTLAWARPARCRLPARRAPRSRRPSMPGRGARRLSLARRRGPVAMECCTA